jgi:hypothetical protein
MYNNPSPTAEVTFHADIKTGIDDCVVGVFKGFLENMRFGNHSHCQSSLKSKQYVLPVIKRQVLDKIILS